MKESRGVLRARSGLQLESCMASSGTADRVNGDILNTSHSGGPLHDWRADSRASRQRRKKRRSRQPINPISESRPAAVPASGIGTS